MAEQEVRFAVVMYGGVSLAIYMNGISQELLRVVRATSDLPDAELTGTERVYRKLGRGLSLSRRPGEPIDGSPGPVRSRVVVDILSGTSAGGINAVFLAKALALGSQHLGSLAQLWKEEGDLGKLLNDQGSDQKQFRSRRPATSLLNSQRMYGKLLSAMDALDQAPRSGLAPMAEEIDLFVTATDLHGIYKPLELTDSTPEERIHKMVFHFQCESPQVAALTGSDQPKNQFTSPYNLMLAFAARCTSSFPGAFEPMKLTDIREVRPDADLSRPEVTEFFRRYQKLGEATESTRTRSFADGGYLDNRPFSYPIEALAQRDATIPVERKLLILDPFPEYSDSLRSNQTMPDVNFAQNLMAAATSLPRYETIRQDLERIQDNNRRVGEVRDLIARMSASITGRRLEGTSKFRDCYLDDLVNIHGPAYRPYHHLRVLDASRQLATLVTRRADLNPESDEAWAIRQIVEVWRTDRYHWDPGAQRADGSPKVSENVFLEAFDVDFRMRRLNHLRLLIDELLRAPEPNREWLMAAQLTVRQHFARLAKIDRRLVATPGVTRSLGALRDLLRPHLRRILRGINITEQRAIAREVMGRVGIRSFDEIADQIASVLFEVFTDARSEVHRAFATDATQGAFLQAAYNEFPSRDAVVYPVLRGTGADEAAEVQVFRVGPAEARLHPDENRDRPDGKLAGIGLGAFAGFLSRRWRENDILWGRLDGADRIISALLPDLRDEAEKAKLILEAQEQIIQEELAAGDGLLRASAAWVREQLGRDVGSEDRVRALLESILARPEDPLARLLSGTLTAEGFDKFMRSYYRRPQGPAMKEQLAFLGRALAIFSEMLAQLGQGRGAWQRIVGTISFLASLLLTTLALGTGITGRYVQRFLLAIGAAALVIALLSQLLPQPWPPLSTNNWLWAVVFFVAAGVIEWIRRWLRAD